MIPVVWNKFFSKMPEQLDPLLHSGILLATISAVALKRLFQWIERSKKGEQHRSERPTRRGSLGSLLGGILFDTLSAWRKSESLVVFESGETAERLSEARKVRSKAL
jgi:hypothetical protein